MQNNRYIDKKKSKIYNNLLFYFYINKMKSKEDKRKI